MSRTAIKVENLSKLYRLGEVGAGTISQDLNRWWARVMGKEDPLSQIGSVNDRTQQAVKGEHVWALKDINFEVQQGEVLGIIGKNGAGKSTLLKLLSKITAPTTGSIKAKGRIASLLEVGTGMNPEMTGIENVYLNGTILGMTKREIKNKLDDILDFAGCAKYGDTPVKRYSSGMKVRLGFAVAAFLEPEILIVDEVLAVGDAEFQKRAIGKMQDISRGGGRTVLFVSHNMASVQTLCQKGILLDKGKVSFAGKIDQVVKSYLSKDHTINIGSYNAISDNKTCQFKSIKLKGDVTDEVGKVGYHEIILVEIIVSKKKEIPSLVAYLRFYNEQGMFIFASNSIGSNIDLSSKGDTILKVEIPNVLAPGKYYLDAGLQQMPSRTIQLIQECLAFNVENITVKGGDRFKYTGQPIIGLSTIWQQKQTKTNTKLADI